MSDTIKYDWTQAELEERFRLLEELLKTTPLPTESGATRIATADEFMLMHENGAIGATSNIRIVNFKHRFTRNYICLLIDGYRKQSTIRIPGADLPRAERKNFAQAEFDEQPRYTAVFMDKVNKSTSAKIYEKSPRYGRQLPIVLLTIDAGTEHEHMERFYADERLREYRAVGNPHFRINEDEIDAEMIVIIKAYQADQILKDSDVPRHLKY